MKKLITSILLTVGLYANAQYVKVTPQGLKDNNEDKTFVVLDLPNQTQADLYNKSVKYVHQSFKNPEIVIKSNLPNESLRYVSYKPNGMRVNNSGVKVPVEIKYAIQLDFKDNKVRFEIVEQDFGYLAYTGSIWKSYPIWNEKNGKLRLEDEKNELETYFNAVITDYYNYLNGGSIKNEDW